jgi:predicted RNase H-like HicB family nuclease
MKQLRTYTIVVEPDQHGGYFVTIPPCPAALPGQHDRACQERAVEAIGVHIAGLQADGEPVPEEAGPPQLLAVTVAA